MAPTNIQARDVLISIRPVHADKILSGEKTVELRRRFPERVVEGGRALIYSSSPIRAIVGFVQIREVQKRPLDKIWNDHGAAACVPKSQFDEYFVGLECGFAILLGGVEIFKNTFESSYLRNKIGFVPPQSFCYLNDSHYSLLNDAQY